LSQNDIRRLAIDPPATGTTDPVGGGTRNTLPTALPDAAKHRLALRYDVLGALPASGSSTTAWMDRIQTMSRNDDEDVLTPLSSAPRLDGPSPYGLAEARQIRLAHESRLTDYVLADESVVATT
jgi:hypothetical protein